LNEGKIKELLENALSKKELFGDIHLKKIKYNLKQWQKPSYENTQRLKYMKALSQLCHPS
jgi:hypothetical protein